MTLDELCGRTGLSRSTVQRYFRLGVIPHEGGSFERDRSFSLPLDFDEEDAACVELVRNLTRKGVPLNSIHEFVENVGGIAGKKALIAVSATPVFSEGGTSIAARAERGVRGLVADEGFKAAASAFVSAVLSAFLREELAPRSPQIMVPATPFDDSSMVYDRGDSPSPVRGTEVSPPTRREASMISSPQWRRSIGSYTSKELRALKFRSTNEVGKAIDLIWSHADLRGLPRMTPDGITLIVPEEAVRYFAEAGLRFAVFPLANRDDLPPERLAELRRKHGM